MKRLWHRLMHLLGRNHGQVVTQWDAERDVLWVGYRCECGEVQGVHAAPRHISHPEERFHDVARLH